MVATDDYEGWCNRETWLVSLWLINDESSYSSFLDGVRTKAGTLYDKAEWLESMIRESYEIQYPQGSLWTDLMYTTLGRVNWYELVEENS